MNNQKNMGALDIDFIGSLKLIGETQLYVDTMQHVLISLIIS